MSSKRAGFPVTVHVLFWQNDKLLLLRRQNTGYRDGWFSLVAGHVEMGETLRQAAIREAYEEIGVELATADLALIGVMHRRSQDQRVDFFLETHKWKGNPINKELSKAAEIGWYALDGMPPKVIPYVERALSIKSEAVWFDEFGWD